MKFEVMKGLGSARDTIFTLELKYWGVIFKVGGKKLYFFKFLTPLSSSSYAEKRNVVLRNCLKNLMEYRNSHLELCLP